MSRMYARGIHDMWSSTLSLNAMTSGLSSPHSSSPFRRSKGVRNLSLYDGDEEDLSSGGGRRHLRRVVLRRSSDAGAGLGFSIRGGRELGIGIFVSKVVERSVADRAGLGPGDQILAVNDTSFEDISHEEAIKILKSAPRLQLLVCSTGRVPGSCVVHQTYTWLDSEGRTVSPPPEYDHSFYSSPAHRKAVSRLHHVPRIRKVSLRVDKSQSLGLMIRGGVECGLGVYITGVDPHSVADLANLKVGDQILEVNNQSFLDITHDEAVRMLKYSPHMVMTIREVGKVPYSCTTYDDGDWLSPAPPTMFSPTHTPPLHAGRLLRKSEGALLGGHRDALVHTIDMQALRILNEKAKLALSKQELATLNYYRIEYERGRMAVEALVAVLLELFETEEKYSLLQDVREVIHPLDLPAFDELIYKKDLDMARTRRRLGPDDRSQRNRFSSVSMDHLTSHVATSQSSPRTSRRGTENPRFNPAYIPDPGELRYHGTGDMYLPQQQGSWNGGRSCNTCVDPSSRLLPLQGSPRTMTDTSRRSGATRSGRRRGHAHPPPPHSAWSGQSDMMGLEDEGLRTPSEDSGVDLANGPYAAPSRAPRERAGEAMAPWHANGSDPRHCIYRPEESLPPRQGQQRRHCRGGGDMGMEYAPETGGPRRRSGERRWSIGSDETPNYRTMDEAAWDAGPPTPRYPKWRPGRSSSRYAYSGRSSSLPRP